MLPTKVTTPCTSDYRPELNQSPELDEQLPSYFVGWIGVLRWCIELSRIDIVSEVSLLSCFLANPCEGHLQLVFHILGYFKRHERWKMVIDDGTRNRTAAFQEGRLERVLSQRGGTDPQGHARSEPRGTSCFCQFCRLGQDVVAHQVVYTLDMSVILYRYSCSMDPWRSFAIGGPASLDGEELIPDC